LAPVTATGEGPPRRLKVHAAEPAIKVVRLGMVSIVVSIQTGFLP
jgi:hypothetical protein